MNGRNSWQVFSEKSFTKIYTKKESKSPSSFLTSLKQKSAKFKRVAKLQKIRFGCNRTSIHKVTQETFGISEQQICEQYSFYFKKQK